MKQAFINYLRRYTYPQKEYAEAILRFVDKNSKNDIIDVPCGAGISTWNLAKAANLNVYGYDLSKECIADAKNSFKRGNLVYAEMDVKDIPQKHPSLKYYCIINFLFLFSNADFVLEPVKKILQEDGTLFVIMPNIDSPSFKWFDKNNPGVNQMYISEKEIPSYFAARGWSMKELVPLAYAPLYGRIDTKFLSVFAPFYLRFLNKIQTALKIGKPSYFLIVLAKAS